MRNAMAKAVETEEKKKIKENEKKWTRVLMEPGWTVIPSVILERQKALGLDATDMNIILHLARHWWYSEKLPYPSKREIADCMGIHPDTVRKRIARMENDGLISRNPRRDNKYGGQTSNSYSFEGLINEATPYAQEAIDAKKSSEAETEKRRTRKRPLKKAITKEGEE